MTRKQLAAILPGAVSGDLPKGASVVSAGGFSAVLMPVPRQLGRGRRALLIHARQRQELLESLMAHAPVLPALTGTILPEKDVPRMLLANGPVLTRLAADLAGKVQYQVQVAWDAAAAPARFGADVGIAALRARLAGQCADLLHPVCDDLLPLPVQADVIFNAALLLGEAAMADLDCAVEAVDAIWSDGFAIRQIGPSPAVSFCSLGLRSVAPRAIRAARVALGLDGALDPAAIRTARRRCLMAADEGAREPIKAAAELLDCVTACPEAEAGFHKLFTWSEGRAGPETQERAAA